MDDIMVIERYTGRASGGRARIRKVAVTVSLTITCAALGGCDTTDPGSALLRFGQSGEIQVTVETPLHLGLGWKEQAITWRSDGAWRIREELGYKGVVGEVDQRSNPGLPLLYTASYATVIQNLNDNPGVKLVGVDHLELTECDDGKSRVTVRILDSRRGQQRVWVRCAFGTLATLQTAGSGPDVDAARVVEVAMRVRDNTVGSDFRSIYVGSLPFATIDKGTETGWQMDESLIFRSPDGEGHSETQQAWNDFWRTHRGNNAADTPGIDWSREMALAGLVGVREEVGDSVEIRGVITVSDGTKIELVERVPGDFCAPARREVRPFHIVLAPRAPAPVFFTDLRLDPVPCGTS